MSQNDIKESKGQTYQEKYGATRNRRKTKKGVDNMAPFCYNTIRSAEQSAEKNMGV